jgi:hypothetical protein
MSINIFCFKLFHKNLLELKFCLLLLLLLIQPVINNNFNWQRITIFIKIMIEKNSKKNITIYYEIIVSEIKIILTNNIIEKFHEIIVDFIKIKRNVMNSRNH